MGYFTYMIKTILKSTKLARMIKWQIYYQKRLPLMVELELDSICNRKCIYCPVSIRPRPHQKMSFELFKKIISNLNEINWKGILLPHFFNEPLIDKRLKSFLSYAKNILKDNVKIIILTNGDLLNIGLFSEWVEKLKIVDLFNVSIHDDKPKKHLLLLQKYVTDKSLDFNFKLNNIKSENTPKYNRGGLIKIKGKTVQDYLIKYGCNWALKMVITASGNYLICCNDYEEKNIFGNINNFSIKELWFDAVNERKNLYLANYERPICKACIGLN